MRVSETIITGFQDPEVAARELGSIDELLALERSWYESCPLRFQTDGEIIRAASFGLLERIVPDENIKPAMRFLNPRLDINYPPYLMPFAADMLRKLGQEWRLEAELLEVHPNVRLSVSSLVRNQEFQDELVRKGKLAVTDSTHVCGRTFDLDLSGYRVVANDGSRDMVVSLRTPDQQATIANAFATDYGAKDEEPIRLGPEYYDPRVAQALMMAAQTFYENGWINMVPEGVGTKNSALHVSVVPPYHL